MIDPRRARSAPPPAVVLDLAAVQDAPAHWHPSDLGAFELDLLCHAAEDALGVYRPGVTEAAFVWHGETYVARLHAGWMAVETIDRMPLCRRWMPPANED